MPIWRRIALMSTREERTRPSPGGAHYTARARRLERARTQCRTARSTTKSAITIAPASSRQTSPRSMYMALLRRAGRRCGGRKADRRGRDRRGGDDPYPLVRRRHAITAQLVAAVWVLHHPCDQRRTSHHRGLVGRRLVDDRALIHDWRLIDDRRRVRVCRRGVREGRRHRGEEKEGREADRDTAGGAAGVGGRGDSHQQDGDQREHGQAAHVTSPPATAGASRAGAAAGGCWSGRPGRAARE